MHQRFQMPVSNVKRRQQMPSQTTRYFLDRFGAATLHGAVERAATRLRPHVLPGLENTGPSPVDLKPILDQLRIRVGPDLDGSDAPAGRLVPTRDGFIVRLKQ